MEQISKQQTIALRQKLIGPSCQLFFRNDPLKIVRAKGQYMYDENNNAYLDCINNVAHVGHGNQDVVKAGSEQMALLNTNNRFLHDNIVLCAEKIVNTLPDNLEVCFFVNSGSEANDLALRLAQIHTGNKDIIALEHAYHGHLTSLIDISHYKFNLPGGVGQKSHVHVAPCPDSYRGKYRDINHSETEVGKLYADEVQSLCNSIRKGNKKVCAFIAESFLSCGGQVIPPKNYFQLVYESVRQAGGICIADEVQVGFGRSGKHWWAFQHYNVKPDIVTMGKPMGNGHPVALVVTTREIADSFFKTGVEYFNTYGGNPVSCAIANAVIDTIKKDNLMQHALIIGEYLLDSFRMLTKKHKCIGQVRGCGLFVGIDLVDNPTSRRANRKCAEYVVQRMREEQILVSADGPECNVIKLKPPMVFSKDNADEVVDAFDCILTEFEQKQYSNLKRRSIDKPTIIKISETHSGKGSRREIIKQTVKSI